TIKELYSGWQDADTSKYSDVAEYCKSVSIDDIRKAEYFLVPSKYVEFIDHDLDIDYPAEMSRIQAEMKDMMRREKQSQAMLEDAFGGIGYGID
ncbi:MAG: restriction endonuclease subunit M, partial [Lachnospiraceae bacterium]|nr:restriction endonuclease subunit M [Lachnospiraceae bacterium]